MKKGLTASLMGILLGVFMCSVGHAQEAIKLKFAQYFVPLHRVSILGDEFCQEIKKRTNGRVDIAYHTGATLLSGMKMYQGVVSGIADIGFAHIAYTRGRFPVTEVQDLPLGFPSGWVSTHVAYDFYQKFKPAEWNDVKVLWHCATGPNIIHMGSIPVRKLEDLKNKKIRGVSRVAEIVKALGANPVSMEFADVYESMRRGVLDGNLGPLEQLKGWKIGEVAKHITLCYQIGSVFTFYAVMNKDKWNALPDDIKKIFDEVSKEWMEKYAQVWNDVDVEAMEYMKGLGRDIIPLSDEEAAKWKTAVQPVIDDYKKGLESKGFKSAEIDEYINFVKNRIPYWRNKEKELGVKAAQ